MKYDLILIRHYLEHFAGYKRLIKTLKDLLAPKGCIYFEVPDNSLFIKRKIPLYLWEQHRVFFTDSTLAQTLEQEGLNIIMSESQGTSIEPSLCFLSTKESHDYSTENIKS